MMTLEEIAKVEGLTHERIRQIEAKALRKLRHPAYNRLLKPFIEPDTSQPWENCSGRVKPRPSLTMLDWAPNYWPKVI
jgi:hypothetical protein